MGEVGPGSSSPCLQPLVQPLTENLHEPDHNQLCSYCIKCDSTFNTIPLWYFLLQSVCDHISPDVIPASHRHGRKSDCSTRMCQSSKHLQNPKFWSCCQTCELPYYTYFAPFISNTQQWTERNTNMPCTTHPPCVIHTERLLISSIKQWNNSHHHRTVSMSYIFLCNGGGITGHCETAQYNSDRAQLVPVIIGAT